LIQSTVSNSVPGVHCLDVGFIPCPPVIQGNTVLDEYLYGMQPTLATEDGFDTRDLLQRSEVSIWLDGYDDIFSDFDPRPYTQRAISDDFIAAVRKAIQVKKTGGFELTLLMPKASRDEKTEALIRKRIQNFFQGQFSHHQREIRKMRREGLILSISSIGVLFTAASLPQMVLDEYLKNLLQVILTPGGWFMIFNGLDSIFYKPRHKKTESDYCRKLSRSRIVFVDY